MAVAAMARIAGGAVTNDRTTCGAAAADLRAARRRIGAVAQAAPAVPAAAAPAAAAALAAVAVPAAVATLAVATVQAKSATAAERSATTLHVLGSF